MIYIRAIRIRLRQKDKTRMGMDVSLIGAFEDCGEAGHKKATPHGLSFILIAASGGERISPLPKRATS
eukprot:5790-Eustigmatos_ZCMA.PRE.1